MQFPFPSAKYNTSPCKPHAEPNDHQVLQVLYFVQMRLSQQTFLSFSLLVSLGISIYRAIGQGIVVCGVIWRIRILFYCLHNIVLLAALKGSANVMVLWLYADFYFALVMRVVSSVEGKMPSMDSLRPDIIGFDRGVLGGVGLGMRESGVTVFRASMIAWRWWSRWSWYIFTFAEGLWEAGVLLACRFTPWQFLHGHHD